MNPGDLVRISSTGDSVWCYSGTAPSGAAADGKGMPKGTLGVYMGPSDRSFPLSQPAAVLFEGKLWTITRGYLETVNEGDLK